METQKKIGIAFIINLSFAVFEWIGGSLTGSVAIVSDAVHDLGDACSIGLAYLLERKSQQTHNPCYSILSAQITNVILLIGSASVIVQALYRFFHPAPLHTMGMFLFAAVGVLVNFAAARVTHGGHSHNQKAVNLHMLEDVLGWIAVLAGSILIHFTGWNWIDPALSVGLGAFIAIHAAKNLRAIRMPRPYEETEQTKIR